MVQPLKRLTILNFKSLEKHFVQTNQSKSILHLKAEHKRLQKVGSLLDGTLVGRARMGSDLDAL